MCSTSSTIRATLQQLCHAAMYTSDCRAVVALMLVSSTDYQQLSTKKELLRQQRTKMLTWLSISLMFLPNDDTSCSQPTRKVYSRNTIRLIPPRKRSHKLTKQIVTKSQQIQCISLLFLLLTAVHVEISDRNWQILEKTSSAVNNKWINDNPYVWFPLFKN